MPEKRNPAPHLRKDRASDERFKASLQRTLEFYLET